MALVATTALAACQTAPEPSPETPRKNSPPALASAESEGSFEVVATFEKGLPTGVAVSDSGRIFVGVPRWGDRPFTLAEVVDGEAVPFPSRRANDYQAGQRARALTSVESVVVGPHDDLWVLDTGRPHFRWVLPGGAKLVRIDLETDEILRKYILGGEALRRSSYLAGLRIDLRHGDEGMAYITDGSEMGMNGLVVVDLASGEAWRKLDLHPTTRATPEFLPIVEGRPMYFQPEGTSRSHLSMGAHGIALSPDHSRLYYTAMADRGFYSVRVDALVDREISPGGVEATLRRYADPGFAADGLATDRDGRLYLANYEDSAIMRWSPGGPIETFAHDPRLLWPDSIAIADGSLYVTVTQRHRQSVFNDGEDRAEPPYALLRTDLGKSN